MRHFARIVLAAFMCSCGGGKKTASDHSRDTAALGNLFPGFEAEQVTAFRYQDWCQVIGYNRGMFSHSTEGNRPHPATRNAAAFDPTATADLERIWKSIEASDTGVYLISDVKFDPSGRVVYGEFDCSSGFVRQRYVFDPGYSLPADLPNERWHTKVDSDWYYVLEDWN